LSRRAQLSFSRFVRWVRNGQSDRNRDFGFAGFQDKEAGRLGSWKARRLGSREQVERQMTDDGRQMAEREA